ncbi:MAG: large repetitive protein, partial [Solirubrobacteraceae bacterium]|nr:large repetitive protein [Solirubrobacteraceae bacterium]
DASAFSACTSPTSYPGPLASGSHSFQVRAATSTGQLSTAASYSWLIDRQSPSITMTFPLAGGSYNAAGWSAGCAKGPGICGSSSDPSGVASVAVSIRQGAGNWWGGSSFNRPSEFFIPAAGTTTWSLALAMPNPPGSYSVNVRATDRLGNATPAASSVSATFTIDMQPPPAPAITAKPPSPSTSPDASFSFSDAEAGVSFLCRLDGAAFAPCSSPTTFSALKDGSHTFGVQARDAAGNVGSPVTWTWTIDTKAAAGKAFTISGNAPSLLYPGGPAVPIAVRLTNPNSVAIFVTSLTVSVSASGLPAGCNGAWFSLAQSSVSPTAPVQVPGNGSLTLPAQGVGAPTIRLLNVNANQDACKNVQLTLAYSGSAHS